MGSYNNKVSRVSTSASGVPTSSVLALTTANLSQDNTAEFRTVISKFSWTNAQVAALAGTANTLDVCTLPARTVVDRAWVIITGAATGVTVLTASVGRTGAGYIDYIVASDAKATSNTVYGDAIAEVGTSLSALVGDFPSLVGTTSVKIRFDATAQNLNLVTGSTGSIYLETHLLP